MASNTYKTVKIERDSGITWVSLNRPEKRNAMNPAMHYEMLEVLDELEFDPETKIVVLTGEGNSWCAGQDLKESFKEMWDKPLELRRSSWAASEWRWRRLNYFPKPTIAMVNGYCFGGAFTQLIACDFALAAEEATFGLSEVNWGSFPGGLVSRVLAEVMNPRDALRYMMTGDTFDGTQAAAMRLVTATYPLSELRAETEKLARKLLTKNQHTLRYCKEVFKHVKEMDYTNAEEYMWAKMDSLNLVDPGGRAMGIGQFVDEKSYQPGHTSYRHAR
ncbi:MAG TPA: p-hydroxycinnamoyl CoA hydratase/lyase [Dehalococcoidia bacterium]|nr:p-hydroxycinnamoyl CoA hydratase/lyase [Dehalococcoidia bacterium]